MKIAIVFDDCMRLGGVERVINNLADYFSDNFNYTIEVINYNMNSKKQNFIYNSAVKITDLTIKNTKKDFISKFINKIKMRKKLKKHLEKNKYDIILCMAALSNILVAQVRKGIDAKVIGTEHVPYDGHSLKTKIKRRIFYKNLDALVVLTQEDYDKNAKYFKNVSIIYNSIPDTFKYENYNVESKKILAAGRLTEGKGFDILIKCTREAFEKYPDWNLEILGEGEKKKELENLIEKYNLSQNITIKDFIDNMEEVMKEYSFFVMTSKYEGFGLVLVEAQATGLPVISFDCKSGPKEIINNNIDGVLVKAENENEMSKAIVSMIEDKEFRKKLSKNAVINSERFRNEKIGNEWKELFEKMIKKKSV